METNCPTPMNGGVELLVYWRVNLKSVDNQRRYCDCWSIVLPREWWTRGDIIVRSKYHGHLDPQFTHRNWSVPLHFFDGSPKSRRVKGKKHSQKKGSSFFQPPKKKEGWIDKISCCHCHRVGPSSKGCDGFGGFQTIWNKRQRQRQRHLFVFLEPSHIVWRFLKWDLKIPNTVILSSEITGLRQPKFMKPPGLHTYVKTHSEKNK